MSNQEDSEFVTLNIGGTVFLTTRSTLCLKGSTEPSSYFTGLLSGKIPVEKDSNGAILIDRSPEKFRVILEFLRTGHIEIPPGMDRKSLETEGEYYCLDSFVDFLNAEPKSVPRIPVIEPLRKDGCYVHPTKGCYHFVDDSRFIFTPKDQHYIEVFLSSFPVGELWNTTEPRTAEVLATMATQSIVRGTYKTEENKLVLRSSNVSSDIAIMGHNDTLLVLDFTLISATTVTGFKFHPW